MNIIIKSTKMQFKNPKLGDLPLSIEDHYFGRYVIALVNGKKEYFRFTKEEVPFQFNEEQVINAIKAKLENEHVEM